MGKRNKNNILEDLIIGIFKAIGMFFVWFFRLIFHKNKPSFAKATDGDHYNIDIKSRWVEVEQMLNLQGASQTKQAVLLADNLIDAKLKSLHIAGETMGERLKNATRNFSWDELQTLWNLHKLRNEIAHNPNAEIFHHQAKMAIEKVKDILIK